MANLLAEYGICISAPTPICLGSTHHVAFGTCDHTALTEIPEDEHFGVAVIKETFDLECL